MYHLLMTNAKPIQLGKGPTTQPLPWRPCLPRCLTPHVYGSLIWFVVQVEMAYVRAM
jgi:hypothetical protein